MANILGGITGFFDKYILGFALGTAAGPSLEPFVQHLANDAWELNQVVPPQVYVLAEGVAQGQVSPDDALDWAHKQGIGDKAFNALVDIANTGPGATYAFQLWRRNVIGDAGFKRALKRMGLEPEWIDDLTQLKNVLLTPAELANARQQGFIDQARQEAEAELQGITTDRADIQFKLSGLPPGVDVGQRAANRNLIDRGTFGEIVREGHTKTKYTDLLWQMRHPVLSASVYSTLHLKGWISTNEMEDGGALTGYTPEQMHLMFLAHGRPATEHQIHIGYARGASLPGASNELDAIATAVKQSDIRPEYTEIIQANRYSYPSAFVLRSLAQAGDIGGQQAVEQILLEIGWKPSFAQKVSAAWTTPTSGGADTREAKAQTQLWNTTHSSYKAQEISDATATAALSAAGVAAAAVPAILALWKEERSLVRKQLSPTQIRKALNLGVVNPATKVPWTVADAHAALIERGYDDADATVFLQE